MSKEEMLRRERDEARREALRWYKKYKRIARELSATNSSISGVIFVSICPICCDVYVIGTEHKCADGDNNNANDQLEW